jgi:hypothetical protein
VTRAAAVPRLLPPALTLVKANARVSLAGVVGATVSAPIAVLASTAGSQWSLRYAFVLFVVATVLAIRLPERVDSSVGEEQLALMPGPSAGPRTAVTRRRMPAAVAFALKANCGPRWLSGFLIMFMAFLLRDNPISDWRPEALLGLVIGAAGLGNTLGIALGSLLRRLDPALTVVLALVADVVAVLVAALFYGLLPLALLGLTAGLAQSLAKLSLDSTIQRDVPERVQASAFARSDTTLQLAAPRPRGRVRRPGRVGCLRPHQPAVPQRPDDHVTRPRRLAAAYSSSSSASARSSLAVGRAVLASGWRPWR